MFTGLTGWVYIHHNHLTELRESVWRNLLEIEGYVDPYGELLICVVTTCSCTLATVWPCLSQVTFMSKYGLCPSNTLVSVALLS